MIITYIGWVAMIITFIAIYMFNKRNIYAPDAEILGCLIWMIYGIYLYLPEVIIMNIVLTIITAIHYKEYKASK